MIVIILYQIHLKQNGIMDLIKQKQFSKADKEIEGWTENAPSNLPKLKEYLQQEKTKFTQQLINKRREQVRSLIDNNKFPEAKRELAQWEKTGDDRNQIQDQ